MTSLPSFEKARAELLVRGRAFGTADRDTAWSRFVASGVPGARSEAWKYTPVGALLDRPFHPAPAADTKGIVLPASLPGAIRIVFVNGRFDPSLGAPALGSSGPVAVVTTLPSLPDSFEDGLGALNRALFEQGALIDLPDGADGGKVELLHIVTGVGDGAMAHPRAFFRIGRGARLTVFERFVGLAETAYFVDAVSDVQLGENAQLTQVAIQAEGRRALHFGALRIHQAPRSRFSTHQVQLGAGLSRRELSIRLAGEGAETSLDGLSVAGDGQHHDLHVQIDHAVPSCTSRQRFRGLLSGTARGVFTGKVHVHRDAQKTDAAQSARCLLLSPDAEADLRPHLEIHADDVKASHGATVGELDADQLFYLRARGIPEGSARAMLTVAFAREVLDAIPEPALRDRVLQEIESSQRLAPGDAA